MIESTLHQRVEFGAVIGDGAAAATHSETWTNHAGQTDLVDDFTSMFQRRDRFAATNREPDFFHRLGEQFPVLGLVDDFRFGTDHFHTVLFQYAVVEQIHRDVQSGLATERRQQGIGPFLLDNLFDDLPR